MTWKSNYLILILAVRTRKMDLKHVQTKSFTKSFCILTAFVISSFAIMLFKSIKIEPLLQTQNSPSSQNYIDQGCPICPSKVVWIDWIQCGQSKISANTLVITHVPTTAIFQWTKWNIVCFCLCKLSKLNWITLHSSDMSVFLCECSCTFLNIHCEWEWTC